MAKNILIEQFHLDVLIPRGLSDAETGAIRRTLDSRRFRVRIERAIRVVVRCYRTLPKVTVTLTL